MPPSSASVKPGVVWTRCAGRVPFRGLCCSAIRLEERRVTRDGGGFSVFAISACHQWLVNSAGKRRTHDGAPRLGEEAKNNNFPFCGRSIFGKSRHRAHTESQREESGESQFLGSLWRATLSIPFSFYFFFQTAQNKMNSGARDANSMLFVSLGLLRKTSL